MALAKQSETLISGAVKLVATTGLIAFAEVAIFDQPLGWPVGGFCLASAAAVGLTQPKLRSSPAGLVALAIAALLAVVLIDSFSPLGLLMFWIALSLAVLMARIGGFDDAWRWSRRLVVHGALSLFGPILDIFQVSRLIPPDGVRRVAKRAPIVVLPIVGGAVFLSLFLIANPVLSQMLAGFQFPEFDLDLLVRVYFAGFVAMIAWGFLRPRVWGAAMARSSSAPMSLSVATVALSLAVFNGLFALQNGLDLAFLWSGAALPKGVNFADYAHRGAYTLMFTALLAAVFVLVTLQPAAPAAKARPVRWLVGAWIAQNLLLVASSALRTADYVQAYGLTRMRLAALVWMGLVALGLVLIGWRMWRSKSGAWLINANAAAAAVVLIVSSAVDYGSIVAPWNVHHPKSSTGAIDLCYLQTLGPPALVSIVELEHRPLGLVEHDAVAGVRRSMIADLERRQANLYGWRPRATRWLTRARAANGRLPFARPRTDRYCSGEPYAQPPSARYD